MLKYKKCSLDIESYSEAPLKKTGLYFYAHHPSTEINCVCYAFDDEPVMLWIPISHWDLPIPLLVALNCRIKGPWVAQNVCPEDLKQWILAGGQLRSHNFQFERVMLNGPAGQKLGIPRINISQGVCTAVKAATMGLPRALGDAARALGTYPKSEDGKSGMLQLAKPCKITKNRPDGKYTVYTDPDKFAGLYAYCCDDVEAERDLDRSLPDISSAEQAVWELDQKINDRGVKVDLKSVGHCLALIEAHRSDVEKEFISLIGFKPSQTREVAEWVRRSGYDIENLQAATVEKAIKDAACPQVVKRILALRSIHASKAVAKYPAIVKAVMTDDRLRGMFLYAGAATGRWSSMLIQLQNLSRGFIKDPDIAISIYAERNLELVKAMYPEEPMKVFASTVRGMLIPSTGKDMLAVDYAGIESRFIAWVYDEYWKLDAFRKQDNEGGPDNYMIAYANCFGLRPEDVSKQQRQEGKAIDLFGGFEGGVGAFVTMAKTYKVDLEKLAEAVWAQVDPKFLEEAQNAIDGGYINIGDLPLHVGIACDAIKRAWRYKHPRIVQGWKDTATAALNAVKNPGCVYSIPNGKIKFRVESHGKHSFLRLRLPSGRKLSYFSPQVTSNSRGGESVTFLGIETKTRRWMRCSTYGGYFAQNLTQAGSNDLLRHGMLKLNDFKGAGYQYDLIATVHDEAVTEILEGKGSVEEVKHLFCQTPKWAAGLPVAAEGWRAKRYKKG